MAQAEPNFLKAVFWDYPSLQISKSLRQTIKKNHRVKARNFYLWILTRFLERGRVKDVAHYFSIQEIKKEMPCLKLSAYSKTKWNRLIEVYGHQNPGK